MARAVVQGRLEQTEVASLLGTARALLSDARVGRSHGSLKSGAGRPANHGMLAAGGTAELAGGVAALGATAGVIEGVGSRQVVE